MVTEFRGDYYFLSNFYLTPVFYKDLWYPSSEHAYMSEKCDDLNWKSYCCNPNISPADVKRESKHVKLIDFWNLKKFEVMENVVRCKFENTELAIKLLNTGDQNLQEGNWWGDRTWGVDLKVNPNIGENHLGRILMKIRSEIKTSKLYDNSRIS